MAKARKKRKKWPPYKYWTEFLKQEGNLWIGEHRTINHALASILMNRDGKNHSEKAFNEFAEYLSSGRLAAINMMWDSGNKRFVLGKSRIEAITNNPEDEEEHLSRLGQQLDQKTIAAGRKSRGSSEKQCKEFGLPGFKQLNQSRQRLLTGDYEFDVHIKELV